MDLPTILDIAIGLIFVYLILSLLNSEIQEIIAAIWRWRANNLEAAIKSLLNDFDNSLVKKLYQHSLINSITQKQKIKKDELIKPSYIPAETFTSALLETLPKLDGNLEKLIDGTTHDIDDIIQALDKANNLNSRLRDDLKSLARRAKAKVTDKAQQIEQFRREIEIWFDRSMDRASGVYKRYAKRFAILLGFLTAALFNADTLHIFSTLSKDPVSRVAIAQYASQAVEDCKPKQKDSPEYFTCFNEKINNNEISKLSLPIGWNVDWKKFPSRVVFNPLKILSQIIGWSLTGLAISMGASFWFDLLNRVINVRYAGKKPASSDDRQ